MPSYYENPPTAGLPLKWRDWLPTQQSLLDSVSAQLNLSPLQVTCSGTAALIIALTTLAQQHPQRKTVIVPAYTCPLVALAIHHCGLQIQLCDLRPDSIDLDIAQLTTLLNEHVLAVIPTHLGGRVTDVDTVKQLVQPHQISVIEDAAQALGAEVGKHGDIVLFSLAAGKGLTMYEGGLLTAADTQLRRSLQTTANRLLPLQLKWEALRTLELLGYTALYNPTGLHFAYGHGRRKALRRQQWVAAVGDDFDFAIPLHRVSRWRQNVAANALQRLPAFLHTLQQQAQQRIQQLQSITGVQVIIDQYGQGVWPFLMVLLPSGQHRDAVLNQLWASPLGVTRLFIHTLAQYDYLRPIVPTMATPNAEDFAARMLTITNSPWLTDAQFSRIGEVIQDAVC
ncbi:DegT/DnrJ/EryC1/StrS family aminotransferase [Snodgrassella alvi]|uniref:Nucleotide sugar aminotransferase n=1 Tax=Snodgrassella alvi TaxID=1196083 RepID=A0A2N9WUF2_9NEIS|nr:DegT/DnrJ/EryC1/StrS family aminotransferase [Snodgrassella alvi]PIT15464.1 nucleotide sugar aminotransferase [Snodgrassella alvi]PIT16008.1 nucleotide sugar aminotransferase [Snodgrassella alvi]PIT17701.1 nucleotide sugar aminotransferase [Snodgrassella alvi]